MCILSFKRFVLPLQQNTNIHLLFFLKMKKNFSLPIIIAIMIIALSSCNTSTNIVLNGKYGVEQVMDLPGNPEAFVMFNDTTGMLSANMGCNVINANYKLLEGNKIEIENGLSTRMMCPDPELEDAFLRILDKIKMVKTEKDGSLELLDAENVCLVKLIKQ